MSADQGSLPPLNVPFTGCRPCALTHNLHSAFTQAIPTPTLQIGHRRLPQRQRLQGIGAGAEQQLALHCCGVCRLRCGAGNHAHCEPQLSCSRRRKLHWKLQRNKQLNYSFSAFLTHCHHSVCMGLHTAPSLAPAPCRLYWSANGFSSTHCTTSTVSAPQPHHTTPVTGSSCQRRPKFHDCVLPQAHLHILGCKNQSRVRPLALLELLASRRHLPQKGQQFFPSGIQLTSLSTGASHCHC